ncbi:MAG: hypothetical protein H7844_13415, partial [Nitrospirae bacterium YQR-1]
YFYRICLFSSVFKPLDVLTLGTSVIEAGALAPSPSSTPLIASTTTTTSYFQTTTTTYDYPATTTTSGGGVQFIRDIILNSLTRAVIYGVIVSVIYVIIVNFKLGLGYLASHKCRKCGNVVRWSFKCSCEKGTKVKQK